MERTKFPPVVICYISVFFIELLEQLARLFVSGVCLAPFNHSQLSETMSAR